MTANKLKRYKYDLERDKTMQETTLNPQVFVAIK